MAKKKNKQLSIKEEVLFLLLKIGLIVFLFLVLFWGVFGIYRCKDQSMSPALKYGDLVVFYRLQKEYQISDVVVVKKEGTTQTRRIIAKAGDEVDITKEGLKINGYLQQEKEIYVETLPFVGGIDFPIKLKEKEYFVLGDCRSDAEDSRVYGAIKQNEIQGSVITFLRRRGF